MRELHPTTIHWQQFRIGSTVTFTSTAHQYDSRLAPLVRERLQA
jgi:hypothetical protein